MNSLKTSVENVSLPLVANVSPLLLAAATSCKGRCGEKYNSQNQCHCNSKCAQHNNCCSDYAAVCDSKKLLQSPYSMTPSHVSQDISPLIVSFYLLCCTWHLVTFTWRTLNLNSQQSNNEPRGALKSSISHSDEFLPVPQKNRLLWFHLNNCLRLCICQRVQINITKLCTRSLFC